VVGTRHKLTPEESQRVHEAVAAAELRTRARLILVLVPASDHYALYPPLWAALAALAGGGFLAVAQPGLGLPLGFLLQAALFLVLTALFHLWPLRLALVPRHEKHLAAARLAHREFAVHIVGHAPERNGVLLFVSLGERYVEILADREIHAKVGAGEWDRIVADFAASMTGGHTADGLVGAIAACGAVLETHYPRAGGSPV
jgi:putative membrane protein